MLPRVYKAFGSGVVSSVQCCTSTLNAHWFNLPSVEKLGCELMDGWIGGGTEGDDGQMLAVFTKTRVSQIIIWSLGSRMSWKTSKKSVGEKIARTRSCASWFSENDSFSDAKKTLRSKIHNNLMKAKPRHTLQERRVGRFGAWTTREREVYAFPPRYQVHLLLAVKNVAL